MSRRNGQACFIIRTFIRVIGVEVREGLTKGTHTLGSMPYFKYRHHYNE